MNKKAILVQVRATGQEGYVYYDDNNDLKVEKLQVKLIDKKFHETGENILCSPKSLISIGFKN